MRKRKVCLELEKFEDTLGNVLLCSTYDILPGPHSPCPPPWAPGSYLGQLGVWGVIGHHGIWPTKLGIRILFHMMKYNNNDQPSTVLEGKQEAVHGMT